MKTLFEYYKKYGSLECPKCQADLYSQIHNYTSVGINDDYELWGIDLIASSRNFEIDLKKNKIIRGKIDPSWMAYVCTNCIQTINIGTGLRHTDNKIHAKGQKYSEVYGFAIIFDIDLKNNIPITNWIFTWSQGLDCDHICEFDGTTTKVTSYKNNDLNNSARVISKSSISIDNFDFAVPSNVAKTISNIKLLA